MESKKRRAPEIVTKRSIPIRFYGSGIEASKRIIIGDARVGQTPSGERDPNCGCMTNSEIQKLISEFADWGFSYSKAQLCNLIAPIPLNSCGVSEEGPALAETSVELQAFVQRDACSNRRHIAIVKLNLSDVDPMYFQGGAEISVSGSFRKFDGNRRASIKPQGEGKYRVPLLLTGPVGGYGFNGQEGQVRLTKWRSSRKRGKDQRLRIADFVFYNSGGGVLWRVPLSNSIMRGGRGTFEMLNNSEGYSICAKLTPTRQYFNGYFNN